MRSLLTFPRPWRRALAVLALACGGAQAQPSATPAAPVAVLATNLRGDDIVLVGEVVEDGQRFYTTVLRYREPTWVLEVPDAVSRADLQLFDCSAQTRTLAGTRVYRFVEGQPLMAREIDIPAAERRAEPVFGKGGDALVQAVFRSVCGVAVAGGRPAHDPWAQGARPPAGAAPGGPPAGPPPGPRGTPVAQGPGNQPPQEGPESPNGDGPQEGTQDGPGLPPPVEPPEPTGRIDKPLFAGSVFTLRTIAQLADFVYLTEKDIAEQKAVVDYLRDAADLFASRGGEYDGYRKSVTATALAKAQRESEHDLQRLYQKKELIASQGLQQVPLPKARLAFPSFRAELFKQSASGQYLLVFRGSAEIYDWISNLWLGMDLGEVESPHYAAARDLVGELVKQGIRPLVTGHSLGGGMAQYVAHTYGLKVVAFNSSPLPERYLPKDGRFKPDDARLFSALELPLNPSTAAQADRRTGDPVSLKLAQAAKWARQLTDKLKASHHLVAPTCVLTLPQPYRNEIEDQRMADVLGSMFIKRPVYKTLMATKTGLATKAAVGIGINQAALAVVDDPIWTPRNPAAAKTGEEARKRVAKVVVAHVDAAKGAWKMGKWIMSRNMGKTALEMAEGLAEMAAAGWVTRMLEVHSMERFVRGLGAWGDLSPYKAGPSGEGPCGEVLSVY